MTKKDEEAREGGYYDKTAIGYDYDPQLAESEHGVVKVKKGGRMVALKDDPKETGTGEAMKTPVNDAKTATSGAKASDTKKS